MHSGKIFQHESIEIRKRKRERRIRSRFCHQMTATVNKLLLVGLDLGKAIAAVNRAIGLGLKRHTSLAAASGAGGGVISALTGAGVVLARITAGLAALGLILEAALRIKFLFTGGENEFLTALFAYQGLVLVHF